VKDKTIFDKNIESLTEKSPALVNALQDDELKGITLEVARSGEYTFKYKGIYFHSRYEPRKEAELQLEELMGRKTDWIVLFGLGCGYLFEALVKEKFDDENGARVLVYEPSLEIIKGVFENIDLSESFYKDNVCIVSELLPLSDMLSTQVDGMDDVIAYQTTPYKQIFGKELLEFTNSVQNARVVSKVYITTDIESRLLWLENYFKNINSFFKYPDVGALIDKFKGVPAVIVGAGPSLMKNAHLLKDLKDKVLIIAAVSAYKPLLEFGVIPDFVIAGEKIDLAEYFTEGEEDTKIRLLLADVSHPNMLARNVKGKFVFVSTFMKLSVLHAKLWGGEYFPDIGGSVTTTALALGIDFGCDPVVLLGQDLAFGKTGTHASGAVYTEQSLDFNEEGNKVVLHQSYADEDEVLDYEYAVLWIKGLDGKRIASKFDWVTFHKWFEEYMSGYNKRDDPAKIINATEGGAYIEGMEHTTLQDVIDRYVKDGASVEEIITDAEKVKKNVDVQGLLEAYQDMKGSLLKIKKEASGIAKSAGKALKICNNAGITSELSQIIDKVMASEKKLFDESTNVIFMWETVVEYTYELKEYLREDVEHGSVEQFQKDLQRVIKSYSKVRDTAGRFISIMNLSLETIKSNMDQFNESGG